MDETSGEVMTTSGAVEIVTTSSAVVASTMAQPTMDTNPTPPSSPQIEDNDQDDTSEDGPPPNKKLKQTTETMTPMKTPRPTERRSGGGVDSGLHHQQPDDESIATVRVDQGEDSAYQHHLDYNGEDPILPMTPVPDVFRRRSRTSSSSSPSDLSHSSRKDGSTSPILTPYIPEVPPAPPSTPAFRRTLSSSLFDGLSTPLPYATPVRNAAQLEHQQQLGDGAETPAPTKSHSNNNRKETKASSSASRTGTLSSSGLIDDFSDWIVGDRYKMIRMLGRGSYGEVAQALDLQRGKASVAIKRIQAPFDQEVDSVRLFREIHILRRLKGHDCVIDLLDIVQPPSDNLDEINDLYLVFECKLSLSWLIPLAS